MTALQPHDLARLLGSVAKDGRRVAMLFRPDRGSDLALANLLPRAASWAGITVFTSARGHDMLRTSLGPACESLDVRSDLSDPVLHTGTDDAAGSECWNAAENSRALRHVGRWAVGAGVRDVVVGDTRASSVFSDAARMDGGNRQLCMGGGRATGLEVLPPGTVRVHAPLRGVHERDLDEKEMHRAAALLPEECVERLQTVADRREQQAAFLYDQSHDVLHDAVLEASHWGYVVVRRSALLRARDAAGPRAGQHVVVHAMARLIAHISGAVEMPYADDEHISRLTRAILEVEPRTGLLSPLPKGRTVNGIVVRPATGRFAKRIVLNNFNNKRRQREADRHYRDGAARAANEQLLHHPDDLMILTREPDHEAGALLGTRLRGVPSSAPLPVGDAVYWDNRFVVLGVPTAGLYDDHNGMTARGALFDPQHIYRAVLRDVPAAQHKEQVNANELYVRQIRKMDWETITSITSRVKTFQVPYECIRALPAVFQKPVPSTDGSLANFVASPHLGISCRPDLIFTAIRMPRFRTLPAALDPGFCDEHYTQQQQQERDQQQGSRMTGGRRHHQQQPNKHRHHNNNRHHSHNSS